MEETRASLTEKLETLEQQIVETVQGATSAVSETVENVKEAVHETVSEVKETVHGTVDTVKSTFDLRQQVERHPWLIFGGAVAVGFLAGRVVARLLQEPDMPPPEPATFARQPSRVYVGDGNGHAASESGPAAGGPVPRAETKPESRKASGLTTMFGDEIEQLKRTAITSAMGMVREVVTEVAPPPLRQDLDRIVDRVTVKLAGES
jgi:ElaB/YqjD/DUF883 family membrane-anchored ribosome-binding protein